MSRTESVRTLIRISRLLERACGELNLAHYRVLAAVAAGDERASHVAARLALGRPTVSASVDALCRRGLLVREPAAGDHRVHGLRLTGEGERVLADTERAMLARLDTVLERTGGAAAVEAALDELGAALDRLVAERHAERAR